MGTRYVLSEFPVEYEKRFAAQPNDSLYDIVTRAVNTAGGEQMAHLGPACVITPTNQFMRYFQIGILSPDFGEGVQGIELYVCSLFDKIRANKLLIKNAPLAYGGDAENDFKAHNLRNGRAYGFNVNHAGDEPVMNLLMPAQTPEHEQKLLELIATAYIPKDAQNPEDVPRDFAHVKHADAFEWAVNNTYFPELKSNKDDMNFIWFRLSPSTPTGHVYPSLLMKIVVMNSWDHGPRPLARETYRGIQKLLDVHFTPVDPLLWSVGYSTTAPGAMPKDCCPPMGGPSRNNNLQMN